MIWGRWARRHSRVTGKVEAERQEERGKVAELDGMNLKGENPIT